MTTHTATTPVARLLAKVAEAEALAAAATRGPWADMSGNNDGIVHLDEGPELGKLAVADTFGHEANAEFIAASRTLVPQLAAALEQAVTALEFYGDEGKWGDDGPIGTRLDYGWIAQNALRRMAGGE